MMHMVVLAIWNVRVKTRFFLLFIGWLYNPKKPLLIQEEVGGGQGLEGTASPRAHSLRLVLYYNDPYMSIMVITYF